QLSQEVSFIRDLKNPKVVQRIDETAMASQKGTYELLGGMTAVRAVAMAEEVCGYVEKRTLDIAALTITQQKHTSFGFRLFDLDMKSWNFQPLSRELFIQVLRTEKTSTISGEDEAETANRLEDHVVARLIDYPEIDYDAHAGILYDFA